MCFQQISVPDNSKWMVTTRGRSFCEEAEVQLKYVVVDIGPEEEDMDKALQTVHSKFSNWNFPCHQDSQKNGFK